MRTEHAAPPRPTDASAAEADREVWRRAEATARKWTQDALQIRDARLRSAVLAKVQEALCSSDSAVVLAGLLALGQFHSIECDRSSFLPLLMALLESDHEVIRAMALSRLWEQELNQSRFERVLALAEDPSPRVRRALTSMIGGYLLDPRVEDAVWRLLDDSERSVVRHMLRGLRGHHVSPRIEERLLNLAGEEAWREDVVNVALSGLENKSEAVVDELISALFDDRTRESAFWGLTHGIAARFHPKAADAFLRLANTHIKASVQVKALRAVAPYGTARHLNTLDAFARNELAAPEARRAAAFSAARIRRGIDDEH